MSASILKRVSTADAAKCMKCGFCMSVCPVYRTDHLESHVARGRNMLIRMAGENQIPNRKAYEESLDTCLLCGRCQTVCPAQVPSTEINVSARQSLCAEHGASFWQRIIYRLILKQRPLMAWIMGGASLIPGLNQKEGQPLRHMADFVTLFSGGVFIPRISPPFLARRMGASVLPKNGGKLKGRVAFFPGCGFEFFFSKAGHATAAALAQAGYEVIYPKGMTCCGMAVYNGGDVKTARQMAIRNIEALAGFDRIVTGCATCGSTLKNYGQWFGDDSEFKIKAIKLSEKVFDFSEFLVSYDSDSVRRRVRPIKVTYHDPCHLKWHQGIGEFPRRVLQSIKGVELVEMDNADACCGLGGAFGIKHRSMSLSIQASKMAAIKKSGVQKVVTACPGCMVQMMDGARRHGMPLEVMHLSELLVDQI